MEKKNKVIEVSKDEFIEMLNENEELTKSIVEFMETSSELKLTYSELMDVSIALTSWMVNDCLDQMGVDGFMKAMALKTRVDRVLEKELSKRGLEID